MITQKKLIKIGLVLLLVLSNASFSYASDIFKIKNDLAIWNPKTVDWSVAANSDVDNICQIHWVYDNEIDIYLKKNRQNLFYFGADYIGSNASRRQLFQRANFNVILVLNEDQINMGTERVSANKIIAIAPKAINTLDALSQSKSLFLKSNDALYSFPLENVRENFNVYEQCLKDNGQYSKPQSAEAISSEAGRFSNQVASNVPPYSLNQQATDGASLLFSDGVMSQQAAPSQATRISKVDITDSYTGNDSVNAPAAAPLFSAPLPTVTSAKMPEVPVVPVKEQSSFSKSPSNFIKEDLAYTSNDLDNGEELPISSLAQVERNDSKENACQDKGQVPEDVTAVIRNLTRKLSVLEKEKEALRVKAIASNANEGVLSEILACKSDDTQPLKSPDVDFGVSKKQQGLIEELRAEVEALELELADLEAENNLLNASIVDAPNVGKISDAPKVAVLNDKIKDLEIKNIQLNKEVDEFKEMLGQNASSEKVAPDLFSSDSEEEEQLKDILGLDGILNEISDK